MPVSGYCYCLFSDCIKVFSQRNLFLTFIPIVNFLIKIAALNKYHETKKTVLIYKTVSSFAPIRFNSRYSRFNNPFHPFPVHHVHAELLLSLVCRQSHTRLLTTFRQ